MRLLRLEIENWRGVRECKVDLAGGVTLIAGPNEIGKSTIIEAVHTLFNEPDTSKKQNIKAIMPVGEDVGSRVLAEVEAGDYHFVFAKTFNKGRQTTLNILAPVNKQLSGRAAHDEARNILTRTVDMDLWETLLVDQGERVGQVRLRDSAGLARALDEAAGSSGHGDDEAGIFAAVETEYERYFTPKTGRPRYSADQEELHEADAAVLRAKVALEQVEADLGAHQRAAAEARRLTGVIPGQLARINELKTSWQSVQNLMQSLATKEADFARAREKMQHTLDLHNSRNELIASISKNRAELKEESRRQEPLRVEGERVRKRADELRRRQKEYKNAVNMARDSLNLAELDEKYYQAVDRLAEEKARKQQLAAIAADLQAHLKSLASNAVSDAALEALRQADHDCKLAQSRRDTAATSLTISAERDLAIEVDEERIALPSAQTHERTVAAEVSLRIPGVAAFRITPPASAAQLQESLDKAERDYRAIATRLGVQDIADAVAANQRRKDAKQQVDRLKDRQQQILAGMIEAEIAEQIAAAEASTAAYVAQRVAEPALPADSVDAARRVEQSSATLKAKEQAFDGAHDDHESAQRELREIDVSLRAEHEQRVRRETTIDEQTRRLDKERQVEDDKTLIARVETDTLHVTQLGNEAASGKEHLAELEPDAIEAALVNARGVHKRAEEELRKAEQQLAVSEDRLQQARADGRYENLETAEIRFEAAQRHLSSIERRAHAAQLLFTTLTRHRDAARQAYVQPLKEQIESLGRIVFGSDFEIGIDDDWSLTTRTLAGKTIRFADLSTGAREQLGILMRLAAAQIVSRHGGGVPLIFDDVLGFSDTVRQGKMGQAIATAGRNCQIIILTCAPERFTHVGNARLIRVGEFSQRTS